MSKILNPEISKSEKYEKSFGLSFSGRRGVKFLLRDPFTCPSKLEIYAACPNPENFHHLRHLFWAFLCTGFGPFLGILRQEADSKASIFSAMS